MPEKTVLIVEDQESNQELLKAFVSSLGYDSMIAGNGKEALEILRKNTFAIYIVDLMMPLMDGKTFIKKLKHIDPQAVILVQTALDKSETIIDIMKLGVFDYIIKPLHGELFNTIFLKAMEYRKLLDQKKDHLAYIRNEISAVREIQAQRLPKFESVHDYDIAYAMLPAEDLSGDFLDAYSIDTNQLQVVLCDVSGHGIASSFVGTDIRSTLKVLSTQESLPSLLIKSLNQDIIKEQTLSFRYLSTLFLCTIDSAKDTITCSSAGHPAPLLYRAKEKRLQTCNLHGPLIGFIEDAVYSDETLKMEPGDCLLLFTDGITETFSEETHEMFGETRLGQTFLESAEEDASDIIYSVLDNVWRFSNYTPQQDDMTLICIKKN